MNPEEELTVADARKLLGVTVWKMSDILRKKEIPFVTSSWDRRVKLIKRRDIDAWIEKAGPRIQRTKEEEKDGAVLAIAC